MASTNRETDMDRAPMRGRGAGLAQAALDAFSAARLAAPRVRTVTPGPGARREGPTA
jgi:hypothetical protein